VPPEVLPDSASTSAATPPFQLPSVHVPLRYISSLKYNFNLKNISNPQYISNLKHMNG
jgi:hypothetical protein